MFNSFNYKNFLCHIAKDQKKTLGYLFFRRKTMIAIFSHIRHHRPTRYIQVNECAYQV